MLESPNPMGARLREAIEARRTTQLALATELDISPQAVSQWIKYGQITTDSVVGCCRALRINAHWLLTGEGSMDGAGLLALGEKPADSNDFSLVPLYDVKAAAGSGSLVTNEHIVDTLAFRADFLRHGLNAGKDDLYLIHVEGDSMEPTLRAGDVILVDHRRQVPDREGIYVIRMEDALLVKRIQLKPGGKMVATSDNTNYKDFELSAKTAGLAIIGRVVWAGRRF